jgi:hypothetical protein
MLFLADLPVNAPLLTYHLNDSPKIEYAQSIPSPVGQPKFGLRVGFAEADTTAFFGGVDLTVPISAGVRLFAIRGDIDYWLDTNTNGGSRGGDDFAALAVLGPSTSYFGVGPSYASRYGGASGPSGAAVKVVYGSQLLSVVGYEADLILGQKGQMGAIMATFHF